MLNISDYAMYTQCKKSLWLHKYKRSSLEETTVYTNSYHDKESILREEYIRELFPRGVAVCETLSSENQANMTRELIEKKEQTIYNGVFIFEEIGVSVDLLTVNKEKKISIYEFFQSTSVKDTYYNRLAFIYNIASQSKFLIESVNIIIVDNKYIKNGEIKPEKLFTIVDANEEVISLQNNISQEIEGMKKVLSLNIEPTMDIGEYCDNPFLCSAKEYCWKHIPEGSIFSLPRQRKAKLFELYNQGIVKIEDIPTDYRLTQSTLDYIELYKTKDKIPTISNDFKEEIDSKNIDLLKKRLLEAKRDDENWRLNKINSSTKEESSVKSAYRSEEIELLFRFKQDSDFLYKAYAELDDKDNSWYRCMVHIAYANKTKSKKDIESVITLLSSIKNKTEKIQVLQALAHSSFFKEYIFLVLDFLNEIDLEWEKSQVIISILVKTDDKKVIYKLLDIAMNMSDSWVKGRLIKIFDSHIQINKNDFLDSISFNMDTISELIMYEPQELVVEESVSVEQVIEKLHRLHKEFEEAEDRDDEDSLNSLEEEFDEVLEYIKDDDSLKNALISKLYIEEKNFKRMFKLEKLALVLGLSI